MLGSESPQTLSERMNAWYFWMWLFCWVTGSILKTYIPWLWHNAWIPSISSMCMTCHIQSSTHLKKQYKQGPNMAWGSVGHMRTETNTNTNLFHQSLDIWLRSLSALALSTLSQKEWKPTVTLRPSTFCNRQIRMKTYQKRQVPQWLMLVGLLLTGQ